MSFEKAAEDIRYLLEQGYPQRGAISFVCNHYRLNEDARHVLSRAIVARGVSGKRRMKFMPCDEIEGSIILIDGYNIIIGMESILEKKAYLCDDGVIRDVKGTFRNYRTSEITNEAVEVILRFLKEKAPSYVCFLFDAQISKSGALAKSLREKIKEAGIKGEARTSKHVDYDLKSSKYIVATSDGVIIDEAPKVVNFLACVENFIRLRLRLMKTIGIAVTDPNDWTGVALCNAVRHYGMQPVKFSLRDATSNISSGKIYAGKIDLTTLDAIIVRDLGPASQNGAAFRFDILCHLKELGVEVINSPDSIARAANKYVSSFLFKRNGVATPETVVTSSQSEALAALSSFGCAVVKPVFGYKGIGVERVRNDDKGMQRLKNLLGKNGIIYMQEFIPNPGRDIRVFVVDKKVVGSIYRIAPAGGWINNLSRGGSAKPCVLTDEQRRLSLKAAEVTGTVYAGVDIIEGDRDYVIEINGTPSGKGIFEACGVDVTKNIVEYLAEAI